MTSNLDRIPDFFTRWTNEHGSAGACGEIAARLACGDLDPAGYHEIVRKHGVARTDWFRANMVDLVLDYARARLREALLTPDEVVDIQVLKRALHIEEGEFVAHRPAEVSAFIQLALDSVLNDDQVDAHEELYLVSVQAAFDLSYDQFLTLGRAAFERTITTLDFKASFAAREGQVDDSSALARKRAALEPIMYLTSLQRRTIGALF